MTSSGWQRLVFLSSLVLCASSLVLVIALVLSHRADQSQRVAGARELAAQQARLAAGQIEEEAARLSQISSSLADDLSSGQLPKDQLTDRLASIINQNPDLFGVGVAYVPYQYDPSVRLYAPYYRFNPELDQHELVQVEDFYDYTLPDGTNGVRTHWYHEAIDQDAPWSEPLFGTASNEYIADYIVPFYEPDSTGQTHKIAGVVYTTYSLQGIKSLLTSLELGHTGYAFLLSAKGRYITYPDEAYVLGQETIFSVAEQHNDQALREIGQRAINGEHGVVDYRNTTTGQSSWVFIEPIPSTRWSLGAVFIKDEIPISSETTRHQLIWIAIGAACFLFFLSVLALRAYRGSSHSLWAISIIFSALSVGVMVFVWSLSAGPKADENNDSVMVFDNAEILKFLAPSEDRMREFNRTEPVHIPTGVFIQSVEFTSANNVVVSGYIWQRYPEGTPDWVSRGFVFPEAIETPEISEAYRSENGEVIGWNFRTILRQAFDYSKYPFDREDVWLRLWHQDFNRDVILVPDLAAYNEINPTSKPGLEIQDFVLEGWNANSSFFSYRLNAYNTNFGLDRRILQEGIPELYFNVNLSRNFTNPFVSNLLPVVVVMFLLYAVLMIASREDDKTELFGFSTSNVLTFCAALFFVVILGHIDLRSHLNSSEIIYLEYFFFVMYLAILAVSVNSILFVSHASVSLVQYKDNLIPELLYWPAITGLLLGVTLWVFY